MACLRQSIGGSGLCFQSEARLVNMKAKVISIGLVALAVSGFVFGQQENPTWKEYTSPADGFALTVPAPPTPHDSPVLPGATAYAIRLEAADSGVVLRVTKKAPDCSDVISRLKKRVLEGINSGAGPSSAKDLSLNGHPGFEYQWKQSSAYNVFERWYCVDGRLYVFSVNWPSAQPFPAAATRILNSFRLLATNTQR